MRWSVFVIIQCLILLAIGGVFYIHQDRVIALKKPPASIAQWYKPENKRQVWLHTMFKLRREMLAVDIYAKSRDPENLEKWVNKLDTDYQKIAEMVPEWQNRVDLAAVTDIQKAAKEKRYDDMTGALENLDKNCQSCHEDFRAITATMYRAPDFTKLKVGDTASLNAHMQTLSKQVNQIKIAYVDGKQGAALAAFQGLKSDMSQLGAVCLNCHKKSPTPYPSTEISQALDALEHSLKAGSLRDKGMALGTLAVLACAECHGTHRLAYDSRTLFTERKSWRDLLKH